MDFWLLSAQEVISLHDSVLNPGELTGLAKDKSLEGALSRVEFRLQYGFVNDVYDLAAIYAVAIAQAHAFNDANKRTAHAATKLTLKVHGTKLNILPKVVGDIIIEVAQGKLDETELAEWLRAQRKG